MRLCLYLLIASLAAAGGSAIALGESPLQQANSSAKPELRPSGDDFRSLQKEVDDSNAAYTSGNGRLPPSWVEKRWQTYVQKLEGNCAKILEIVRKAPGSPESFAALEWIVSTPGNLAYPFGQQAITLLTEHHAENPHLSRAASVIGYYGRRETKR